MIEALVVAMLAAGFRIRGWAGFERLTGRGTTTARIVAWAIPCAIAWLLLGGAPVEALAIAAAAWIGCLPGWWGSLDLGRQEGTWLRDFALHSARGALWTMPMAVVVWWIGAEWWWLLIAGAACGLIYEAGYWIAARTRWSGTEWGEAMFGAMIGAALIGAAA